jgi:hypothetical protein
MMLPMMMAVVVGATAPAGPLATGQRAIPAAPASAPAAPKPLPRPAIEPKAETGCGYVVATEKKPAKKGDKPTFDIAYKEVAGLKVLGGPEVLNLPKTTDKVVAIRCVRDTIIPGDGDGRVFIETRRELSLSDGARLGVLGVTQEKGKAPAVAFAMREGKLTDPEKAALNARLSILQRNLNVYVHNRRVAAAKAAAAKKAADEPMPAKKP